MKGNLVRKDKVRVWKVVKELRKWLNTEIGWLSWQPQMPISPNTSCLKHSTMCLLFSQFFLVQVRGIILNFSTF